jgi:methylase of polypeptide subunit release factors
MMAKYPLSCLDGSASQAFLAVLQQHSPNYDTTQAAVLDLTYGTGISWNDAGMFGPCSLVASDAEPKLTHVFKQDCFTAVQDRPEWREAFDVAFFDPPYFCDVDQSDDPRQQAYGGYAVAPAMLARYVAFAQQLPTFLKPGGKAIVKCGDQFHVKSRTLMLHHVDWIASLRQTMQVVDFYVYRYHRGNPTAYQVKDRPCSVITHTYFIVAQRD